MVELYADASTAPVGTATQSPFTVTWNTTGLANGAHTLRAKGYEDAGNVGFSVTVPVTVSNYPAPSTSVTSPTGGASGLTGTVGVTAAASAASGLSVSKVELYVDGALFAADRGNPPLDNPVIVNKVLATKLGLEHYHKYVTTDAGGGLQSLANVANGHELLTLRPINEPGRGLSTVVGLTYNSLEEHSESPVGNNWSLSISSLTRFGSPIDIHPNNADSIAGRANRWISIVDGDGTLLRFDGADCGGVVCWQEPPGVHLYLRQVSTTDTTRWWAFTRPDRVTFFYSKYGYPTFVRDRNGNELTFTLTAVQPGDDPGGRSST